MTDEELAAEVRRHAEALNNAIKTAANAGLSCLMRFGSMSGAKMTSVVVAQQSDNTYLIIDLSKRL